MTRCRRFSPASGRTAGRAAGLAAILLLFSLPLASGLTVLYTASLNGNLDGCDCKGTLRAGLVTRASWLRALPDREQTLLVDAGDILDVDPDAELAREILQTYTELGYDAVAVGDQEFSVGVEPLAGLRSSYPLLANNLVLCQEDRCTYFSLEPLLLDKGGEKVGVIALLDPQVFALYPEELKQRIKLDSPEQTAALLVPDLRRRKADWIVALYHGPLAEAQRLARQVPGIDLIIAGHEQRLEEPRRAGQALLASPGEEGNRVGVLTLSRDASRRVRFTHTFRMFRYDRDPKDPLVLERITLYHQKLRDAINQR